MALVGGDMLLLLLAMVPSTPAPSQTGTTLLFSSRFHLKPSEVNLVCLVYFNSSKRRLVRAHFAVIVSLPANITEIDIDTITSAEMYPTFATRLRMTLRVLEVGELYHMGCGGTSTRKQLKEIMRDCLDEFLSHILRGLRLREDMKGGIAQPQ
ncbi:uncharacterized protein APUU_60396A [Aspergillus puulaauensis]|uniref:Secreted protein n=1 Tax=Aspergillus puulaauensis TaxID=1220207 RepID=A0A7R7XUV1_9EURO|nr:uncharacterized protein APUU_60396A [Aspergillus puulaauensis]BCS27348.1 hypothetical protein APUU_60396A [Aspergillus puulaauensis]